MVAYLSKSDASEGFNQIIDFLNGSYIEYALTVNPTIFMSYIKQFWNTVAIKQSNDVTRLQALVDKKKVVVTEAAIRDALHLDDAEGSMSAKRTSRNEFSSAVALVVICLSTGRKFNFSKYIFESLVRNVDSSLKFYMYLRVGKGCSGVDTPLFEGMLVAKEPEEQGDAEEQSNDDNAAEEPVTAVDDEALDTYAALTRRVEHLKHDKVAQNLEITKLKTRMKKLKRANKVKTLKLRRLRKVGHPRGLSHQMIPLWRIETVSVAAVTETVSTTAVVPIVTAAPVKVDVPSTRRRRGVVIRDPEEESSAKSPTETKSKDKG
nr:hypothetical protein [Tanacetum cinerariifolium]